MSQYDTLLHMWIQYRFASNIMWYTYVSYGMSCDTAMYHMSYSCIEYHVIQVCIMCHTPRSLQDETRNAERNAFRNPEWWGDFSQLVKIKKIKFLGISRYKVELKFWFDFQFPGISRYRFKLRFWFKLDLQLTKISPPLSAVVLWSTLEYMKGVGCLAMQHTHRHCSILQHRHCSIVQHTPTNYRLPLIHPPPRVGGE